LNTPETTPTSIPTNLLTAPPPSQRSTVLDRFIQRENLALFKKRLAEPHTATEHEILLKLLAQEEAKYRQLGKGE
jgi:hypothetical protein